MQDSSELASDLELLIGSTAEQMDSLPSDPSSRDSPTTEQLVQDSLEVVSDSELSFGLVVPVRQLPSDPSNKDSPTTEQLAQESVEVVRCSELSQLLSDPSSRDSPTIDLIVIEIPHLC